jgi:hypothetical protein
LESRDGPLHATLNDRAAPCRAARSFRYGPGHPPAMGRDVAAATSSAVPAECLRLPRGALREHDVDEGGAAVVHRLVEGAANVLRVLDK